MIMMMIKEIPFELDDLDLIKINNSKLETFNFGYDYES